jgi:hypothetical protein
LRTSAEKLPWALRRTLATRPAGGVSVTAAPGGFTRPTNRNSLCRVVAATPARWPATVPASGAPGAGLMSTVPVTASFERSGSGFAPQPASATPASSSAATGLGVVPADLVNAADGWSSAGG